jgi:hypothetical protein
MTPKLAVTDGASKKAAPTSFLINELCGVLGQQLCVEIALCETSFVVASEFSEFEFGWWCCGESVVGKESKGPKRSAFTKRHKVEIYAILETNLYRSACPVS